MDMGKTARAIWNYLEADENPFSETRLVQREIKKRLATALFYLCNPFDIVPDHIAGIGYVDDALVINSALNSVKRNYPKTYRKIERHATGSE